MRLTSDSNEEFEGYVLFASRASGNIEQPIGKFTDIPGNAKLLSWYDEATDTPTEVRWLKIEISSNQTTNQLTNQPVNWPVRLPTE